MRTRFLHLPAWESRDDGDDKCACVRVLACVRRARARVCVEHTIRRELALHGRVCKYAALSALRDSFASAEIAVSTLADGPTWKTYGRRRRGSCRPTHSTTVLEMCTRDVPFPFHIASDRSDHFIKYRWRTKRRIDTTSCVICVQKPYATCSFSV